MPKKSIFEEIFEIEDDFEGFKHLFTNKVRKQLYNRVRGRCKRRKTDYEKCLFSELLIEMHKIIWGQEPASKHRRGKDTHVRDVIDEPKEITRPVRFWDESIEHETSRDIQNEFNEAVEDRFERDFCPIHKIRKPCRLCQLEEED